MIVLLGLYAVTWNYYRYLSHRLSPRFYNYLRFALFTTTLHNLRLSFQCGLGNVYSWWCLIVEEYTLLWCLQTPPPPSVKQNRSDAAVNTWTRERGSSILSLLISLIVIPLASGDGWYYGQRPTRRVWSGNWVASPGDIRSILAPPPPPPPHTHTNSRTWLHPAWPAHIEFVWGKIALIA